MNGKYKDCPYRVYGERRASPVVKGEYSWSEKFMPCKGNECAAFEDGYCKRNPYTYISVIKESD